MKRTLLIATMIVTLGFAGVTVSAQPDGPKRGGGFRGFDRIPPKGQFQKEWKKRGKGAAGERFQERRREKIMLRLQELGLSEVQKKAVEDLMKELRENRPESPREFAKKFREGMGKILTEDQKAKWQAMREERRERQLKIMKNVAPTPPQAAPQEKKPEAPTPTPRRQNFGPR